MSRQARLACWVAAAAALVFFTNLGATRLFDQDEALYASCAREMYQAGDWIVPRFNGALFPDKPPLMYWLMMAGFKCFGIGELGARFFSAVLGVATALATFHLGRLLFRVEAGFWAGLAVASSLIFTVSARAATVDSALTFLTTMIVWSFVVAMTPRRPGDPLLGPVTGWWQRGLPPSSGSEKGTVPLQAAGLAPGRWPWLALMYALLGLAMLAKGPVGIVLPVAALGLFLLLEGRAKRPRTAEPKPPGGGVRSLLSGLGRLFAPGNVGRGIGRVRPITGLAVMAAVAVPWYLLVGQRTHGQFLEVFFGRECFQRALQSREGHTGPIVYYLPAIMIGFFPWSVFLLPALVNLVRAVRSRERWSRGYVLVACWVGVFVVLWSLPRTKLPHYVLTAYPGMALMVGCLLDRWLSEPGRVAQRWLRMASITYVVVGLGMAIAVPIIAAFVLPGEALLGLVGLVLAAGGVVCLIETNRGRLPRAVGTVAVTAVVFLTAVFGFAARRVDRYQNAVPMLAQLRETAGDRYDLAAYRFLRESFVFYSGHTVSKCGDAEQLQRFLADSPRPYVLTLAKYEDEVHRLAPGQFQTVSRQRLFLKRGEVVILALRAAGPASQARRQEGRRR